MKLTHVRFTERSKRGLIFLRILIYGAGVIGSLYAALLADAGYDTSIYARGKRLEILKNNGLLYKKDQDLIRAKIKILEEVPDDDIYDFILLTVRENQLYEALTELKNNKSNTIVTMVNSLDSYKKWEDIVGTGKILKHARIPYQEVKNMHMLKE